MSNYNLETLIDKLGFDPDFKAIILGIKLPFDDSKLPDIVEGLTSDNYKEAYENLVKEYSLENEGNTLLKIMLLASLRTLDKYKEKGLSEELFLNSIGALPRFCREYHDANGVWYFDRAWWSGRQISLQIFRIGSLEFERSADEQGNKEIVIHIPSDSDLRDEEVEKSFKAAKEFFKREYPELDGKRMCTCSWLISPDLKEMLPESSNIIKFANRFELKSTYLNDDFLDWVYGWKKYEIKDLPENTSLQRNMKKFLLKGKTFRNGFGVLK